eukprot:gene23953-30237_t
MFLSADITDVGDQSAASSLRRKLMVIANQARYLQQTPLTALWMVLEEHRHNCGNDLLTEFVENLAAFVKQHINDRVVESAGSVVNRSRRGSLLESGINSGTRRSSIDLSILNCDESASGADITRLMDERESNYSPGAGDASFNEEESEVSFLMTVPSDTLGTAHTTGDSDNEEEEEKEKKKNDESEESVTADPQTEELKNAASTTDSVLNDSNGSTAQIDVSSHSPTQAAAPPTSTSTPKSSSLPSTAAAVTPPEEEEAREDLLRSLDAFRAQALAITSSLQQHEQQLQSSAAIWGDLQAMEAQLRRAQEAYRRQQGGCGEVGEKTEINTVTPLVVPSRVGTMVATDHQNVTTITSNVTATTPTNSRPVSPASSSRFFSQPSSSISSALPSSSGVAPGRAVTSLEDLLEAQRRASTNPSSSSVTSGVSGVGSKVNNLSMNVVTKQESPPPRTPPSSNPMMQTPVKTSSSSGSSTKKKLTTPRSAVRTMFHEPPARINMNIFKSPVKRQAHGNKNTYSREQLGWQRTKPLNNAFNERFQTTDDLRIANKTNAVFFSAN